MGTSFESGLEIAGRRTTPQAPNVRFKYAFPSFAQPVVLENRNRRRF